MSDPKITGPNMYYDRHHTNGDRTVTFAVDTIKAAGVQVDKKDMEAHQETNIQVGKKPKQTKSKAWRQEATRFIRDFKVEKITLPTHFRVEYQMRLDLKKFGDELKKATVTIHRAPFSREELNRLLDQLTQKKHANKF